MKNKLFNRSIIFPLKYFQFPDTMEKDCYVVLSYDQKECIFASRNISREPDAFEKMFWKQKKRIVLESFLVSDEKIADEAVFRFLEKYRKPSAHHQSSESLFTKATHHTAIKEMKDIIEDLEINGPTEILEESDEESQEEDSGFEKESSESEESSSSDEMEEDDDDSEEDDSEESVLEIVDRDRPYEPEKRVRPQPQRNHPDRNAYNKRYRFEGEPEPEVPVVKKPRIDPLKKGYQDCVDMLERSGAKSKLIYDANPEEVDQEIAELKEGYAKLFHQPTMIHSQDEIVIDLSD